MEIIYYMYQEQHLTMQWTKIWREKLGAEYSILEGQEAARRCMVNIISNLHHELEI